MSQAPDHNGSPATPDMLTTNSGAPVPDNQNSLTAGNPGPTVLADHYMIEKNAHFSRERVPERVHAKGGGGLHVREFSQRDRQAH